MSCTMNSNIQYVNLINRYQVLTNVLRDIDDIDIPISMLDDIEEFIILCCSFDTSLPSMLEMKKYCTRLNISQDEVRYFKIALNNKDKDICRCTRTTYCSLSKYYNGESDDGESDYDEYDEHYDDESDDGESDDESDDDESDDDELDEYADDGQSDDDCSNTEVIKHHTIHTDAYNRILLVKFFLIILDIVVGHLLLDETYEG